MDTPNTTSTETWAVSYGDANGNSYCFTSKADGTARFVYQPLTPEMSSSGVYSGGDPCEATLESCDVAAFFELLNKLEANTELHAERREMGTGLFRIRRGDTVRRFLIRNGPSRREFEAFVARFREP